MSFKGLFADEISQFSEGSVVDGGSVHENSTDIADYVVIGSGAAGSTAAFNLSGAGYSVILLEEGDWIRTRDFGVDVFPAMKQMFRELGTNVTLGRAVLPVLQGKCVGGSTAINSAIAWRPPERVIARWVSEFGIGDAVTPEKLDLQFEEVEKSLSVKTVEDQTMGLNNSLFGEAAKRLSIRAQRTRRYEKDCVGSANCLTGCWSGKKQSMNMTYIPASLHQGAKIYTSLKVLRVESKRGRAQSVVGMFTKTGFSLRAYARRGVVVAASAVQTPGILRRSGVRSKALGRNFQAQPGTAITARFDRPVHMEVGATQGMNSTQFGESDRLKFETLSLPPEMLALRIPGVGPELMDNLLDYPNILNWAVSVQSEAKGKVHPAFGRDWVQFCPTQRDMHSMRKGLRILSEMMFEMGAKEIWPNLHGMPTLYSADDLHHWDNAPVDPRVYGMMISHLFGSARMGTDARKSVVGTDFQVHGIKGLYVLDSSTFPTNLGVNPQHTIMAMARLGTTQILEKPLAASLH